MKKRKRRCEPQAGAAAEEEDRLSELPDSVIFLILSFVPMIDFVRTTILSKRWRNLWTTTPFLNFNYDAWRISDNYQLGFRSSVNQFLFRWNGVRMSEFSVRYSEGLTSSEVELWVDFAIAKGVEDLHLRVGCGEECGEECGEDCWVPQCLFSCSSLKCLSIKYCKWRIDGVVQWNKLKKLKITDGVEVTEPLISQILSGSPLLEVFELSFLDKAQNLNIRSNSLKELSIHKHLFDFDDFDDFDSEYISLVSASELTIWTPNLGTLRIKGIPFGKCGLIHVPSSTNVTLEFSCLFTCVNDCNIPGEVVDFIEDRFGQILEAIEHVESVKLICGCIQVLGVMKQEKRIYSKVKSLVVIHRFYGYEVFVGPLKLFSQLSRLVLEHYVSFFGKKACNYPSFRAANLPKSFRLQLRTVDITWSNPKEDDIFPFIEFLLKYADKLEKMVFRVFEASQSTNSLLLASQKLLRMPRSSPTCTILTIPN